MQPEILHLDLQLEMEAEKDKFLPPYPMHPWSAWTQKN